MNVPFDAIEIGTYDGFPIHLRRDNPGFFTVFYRDRTSGVRTPSESQAKGFAFGMARSLNKYVDQDTGELKEYEATG
jgi:hypothetical protein